ncbi:ABC transporter permease [Devosia insulae DS-56]|uniref:ABC transporter permease n=1 Tax=Devosia insulae DS-56 TaxID=1116389 RepID=A0A1E5XJ15_9HYPH|nr:ABC transporter permease [Devosia insulae]OEO28514.1 ABC transporter permease [Devosia insulae DS-56]
MTWRELLRRTGWVDGLAVVAVLLVTLLALAAPWLAPFDPQLRVAPAFLPPSASHWFGTDEIGRDMFSRVLLGVQGTWLPALAVIGVSMVVGSCIGLVSGYFGGWVDMVLQRATDLFLILPSVLVALAVTATLGPGLINTMLALMLFWWSWYARITRDEVRRLVARPHFEAARATGIHPARLILRHLLPGVMPALAVAATLDVVNVVLIMSLLSFLGLGQPAPAAELGAMTARSLDSLVAYWWLPVIPAAAIMLICLVANLAGDALRSSLRGS